MTYYIRTGSPPDPGHFMSRPQEFVIPTERWHKLLTDAHSAGWRPPGGYKRYCPAMRTPMPKKPIVRYCPHKDGAILAVILGEIDMTGLPKEQMIRSFSFTGFEITS